MILYTIFDFSIKVFNPFLDFFLFSQQFISGKEQLYFFVFVVTLLLFAVYKIHKWLFALLLIFYIHGLIAFAGVIYFNENFKVLEVEGINLEKVIIGNWCKENNKIVLQKDHIARMHIDGNDINTTWKLTRNHIYVDTSFQEYQDIRVIGFADQYFLNISNPSNGVGNYIDLEYSSCQN